MLHDSTRIALAVALVRALFLTVAAIGFGLALVPAIA